MTFSRFVTAGLIPKLTPPKVRGIHENSTRGEVPAVGQRPGTGGQGDDSDRKRSSPSPCPPACAPGAQTSTLLGPCCWMHGAPSFQKEMRGGGTDAPSARRPVGSQPATNARVRSRRAFQRRSAISDRRCFRRHLRYECITSAKNSLRPLRLSGFLGAWAALRLRASASLRFFSGRGWFLGGSTRISRGAGLAGRWV